MNIHDPSLLYKYLYVTEISNLICCNKSFHKLRSNECWINDFKKIQKYRTLNQNDVLNFGNNKIYSELADLSYSGCLDTIKYIYKNRPFNISRVINIVHDNGKAVNSMIAVLFLNIMKYIEYNDYVLLTKCITDDCFIQSKNFSSIMNYSKKINIYCKYDYDTMFEVFKQHGDVNIFDKFYMNDTLENILKDIFKNHQMTF